jgi:RNA polymerase I-specific transcription initiation factor RRN6
MAGIYDTILQNWIASLPPDVPVRIRQHKEQLARRVAVEVLLACCRIRGHESQELMVSSQRGPSQNSGVTLPILPSKPGETSVSAPSQWPDSLSLPTPPHSSLPSSSLPPSSPPLSPYTPSISSDPKVRLGRHLHIREPSLTPTIIATSVAQVLTHWQSGTDPHKYDWDATERALRPEHLDETSQQQREKERKRRERRQKRQQREDELMRAQVASQQPVVFPRSSPGPMLGGLGSSSQAPSQSYSQVPIPGIGFMGPEGFNIMAPQSQVEPGRFGGRPDKKKKKKGRVSGF